jgi:hypothetical protein
MLNDLMRIGQPQGLKSRPPEAASVMDPDIPICPDCSGTPLKE